MQAHFRFALLAVLFLLLGNMLPAWADFNPDLPGEPSELYRLTTKASPRGYTSGDGRYSPGTVVEINCSADYGYVFDHWTRNGVTYSTSSSFQYTMTAEPVEFVAVFTFVPVTPGDPVSIGEQHRLYLKCEPEGKCSFNRTNGERVAVDEWVEVSANLSQGYVFLGWFNEQGTRISQTPTFSYQMGTEDVTLTAKVKYTPSLPGDPSSSNTENVDNGLLGDVNEDGVVDVADAVAIINVYLSGDTSSVNMALFDVNRDNAVDVADAVKVINIYLQRE